MGLIKEYVDRGIQTETDTVPSPYADPAVVLAAPPVIRHGQQGGLARSHNSISELSPIGSDSAYVSPKSPASPVRASLVSRRLSKRNFPRCPTGDIVNRRVVSMPENPNETPSIMNNDHGKRIVSMPDRVRPVLEPSVELFHTPSPSTAAGDSFGSYSGRRERVRVFPAPSDIPQTPSPPSSPESLLIIATGTQLPEGFLRRKYSPEPLLEEDEAIHIVPDWLSWASSPPRPIPALHGPLSLPYARCPSGAEGTIIEEPDSVAQMIWGLGPDDQPYNPIRTEGVPSNPDNFQNPLHGPSQVPPRLQKKRMPSQQVPKLSRAQISAHMNHGKQGSARTQRHVNDDKHSSLRQVSSDIEIRQDNVNVLPCDEGHSMPPSVGVSENLVNDSDVFPADNNRILEWQLARLRHALRTSSVDMDSYGAYAGRLEPVIPTPGFPHSYPRIFVEPRPNETVNPTTRQSPIELAQAYRQHQLYRQALQKQKLPVQSILPTPPNSSSPQWSSQFSPCLTYCSTLSPELIGPAEHPVSVPPQRFRSGANASQYLRRHDYDNVSDFDSSTNIPSTKTSETLPNVNSAASFRQNLSSSNTLAKYIKQLQALSPIGHFSPFQPVPPPNVPLRQLPTDESAVGPSRGVYHSPTVPTPPSPESPQALSRGFSYHNARLMAQTRPMQRRLSSVPEEDSALMELPSSVSPARLHSQATTFGGLSSHDGKRCHQGRYLEVPLADATRKAAISDPPEFQSVDNFGTPPVPFPDTSPVKVRLPVNKEGYAREQATGKEVHQHGNKKKHRFKKLKGTIATNEQVSVS